MSPFHPSIVHFPIALTFILPFLILAFAFMMKGNKIAPQGWLIIIGLQLATVITGYVALDSGEKDEEAVERVLNKKLIHEHEEAAEVFVGTMVVALVLSIAAFFIRREFQFYMQLGVALVAIIGCYLAYKTGSLGGALVYEHGAANAYTGDLNGSSNGLLPTPGKNTSESAHPMEESESLKRDDNDYGNSDESSDLEDDDSKQED